jgi:hypothetical protein
MLRTKEPRTEKRPAAYSVRGSFKQLSEPYSDVTDAAQHFDMHIFTLGS